MVPRAALLALFLVILGGGAPASAEDPPGRVGRIAHVEGRVSQRAANQDEWSPATANYPLTTGHGVWTESGARAEVQVGPVEVRLNELTELDVLRLDDDAQRFAVRQGSINVRLRDAPLGGFTLDTPRGPIGLAGPGRYRIDVGGEASKTVGGDTGEEVQLTVFEGEAQLERAQAGPVVKPGESVVLAGDPPRLSRAEVRTAAIDQWALDRERRSTASAALTHVSPHMTGHQDLDAHGTWQAAPTYGSVWVPRVVDDGWAPYRNGHWAYVAPWGWTWIDDAPWGFAPFHYGRWVRVGHRWAWWPGTYAARPIYAPALVAFIGGDGWSAALALGGSSAIGWVPLAPHEVYRPHYRTSVTYIHNVNITTVNRTMINTVRVVNRDRTGVHRFANRDAATVVAGESFARGRKAQETRLDVPDRHIEQARTTTEPRHVAPIAAVSRDTRSEHRPRGDEARRERAPKRAVAAAQPMSPAAASPREGDRSERRDPPRDEPRRGWRERGQEQGSTAAPQAAAPARQDPPAAAPSSATAPAPRHAERSERRDRPRDERRPEGRERAAPTTQPAPGAQRERPFQGARPDHGPEPFAPPRNERPRPAQATQIAPVPERRRPQPQEPRAVPSSQAHPEMPRAVPRQQAEPARVTPPHQAAPEHAPAQARRHTRPDVPNESSGRRHGRRDEQPG